MKDWKMAWKVKIPAMIEVEIPNANDEFEAKFQAEELAYDTYGYGIQTPCEGKVIKLSYDMKDATTKPCEPTIG